MGVLSVIVSDIPGVRQGMRDLLSDLSVAVGYKLMKGAFGWDESVYTTSGGEFFPFFFMEHPDKERQPTEIRGWKLREDKERWLKAGGRV